MTVLYYILGSIAFLTIAVYFLQDLFIFKPEKLDPDFKFQYDIPFREVNFDVEEGVRMMAFIDNVVASAQYDQKWYEFKI